MLLRRAVRVLGYGLLRGDSDDEYVLVGIDGRTVLIGLTAVDVEIWLDELTGPSPTPIATRPLQP